MFRHVSTPGLYNGKTQPVDKWLETVLAVSAFSGDQQVIAHFTNGFFGPVSRKDCGLLFTNFKPAYGRSGAYLARPVGIVKLHDAFGHALAKGNVIVPIGDIDYTNHPTRQVLQQCARQWCGGGRGNVDMSDTNVFIMYYSAIQSLVYEFVQSKTLEDLDEWAVPLLSLVRAFATFHEVVPFANKVTETVILVPSPDDMLQKALAYVFSGVKPTMEDQLEMLENIVRRTYRAEEEIKATLPGPLAVFLAAPLLEKKEKEKSHPEPNTLDVTYFVLAFNKRLQAYSEALKKNKGLSLSLSSEVRTILALSQVFETPLTQAQVEAFLAMVKADSPVPWVSLGVLPQQTLVPSIFAGPLEINGLPISPTAIRVKSATKFTAVGKKGTDWTGLQLLSSGRYVIRLTLLGTANAACGESRGEDLKANLRLTLGKDIMAEREHSYSLAGMKQFQRTGDLRGLWDIRYVVPMNHTTPILVEVSKTLVALSQSGVVYALFPRDNKPVLVAFKNVLLTVDFDESEKAEEAKIELEPEPSKTPSMFAKLLEENP